MVTQKHSNYPQRVKSRLKDNRPRGVDLHAADRQKGCPKCSRFIGRSL